MSESESSSGSPISELEEVSVISSKPEPQNETCQSDQDVQDSKCLLRKLKEESKRCQIYLRSLLTLAAVCTDLSLALLLFQLGYFHYPVLIILIDFLPGIITLGFILSFKNECHPLTAVAVLAHPILMPIVAATEFLDNKTTNLSDRKYRLYILDVAKYVIGNLQAPCQMIMTSYLIMMDILQPPWVHSTESVDAENHIIAFRPILTFLSIAFSLVISVKGSTETVDICRLYRSGHTDAAVSWTMHFSLLLIFRVMTWTIVVICFEWYSFIIGSVVSALCLATLYWKETFVQKLATKHFSLLEWPIPIFGIFLPSIFSPESCRPSHVSKPFKLVNQIITVGGNLVLIVILVSCTTTTRTLIHQNFIFQQKFSLLLKSSIALGILSTLVTLLLESTCHKDENLFMSVKTFKLMGDAMKSKFGEATLRKLTVAIRTILFVGAIFTVVIPIALETNLQTGSVTLLVAGYKGRTLTTHIDVMMSEGTCHAKGIPTLPQFRSESMSQFIPASLELIVCGGKIDGKEVTESCVATKPRRKSWKTMPSLPYPLHSAASAVVNNNLYILGGVDGRSRVQNKVLEFDPTSKRWTSLSLMSAGLHSACAVSLKHGIILTGGIGQNNIYSSEVSYLGRTDDDDLAWVKLPRMMNTRASHGCTFVTLEDFGAGVLVAGGRLNDRTVLATVEFMLVDPWALTPITSSWIQLPSLNFARHTFPSVGIITRFDHDTVFVAGGLSSDLSSTDTIEELDIDRLSGRFEWSYRNVTLLKPRHSINSVVVPAYFVKSCH